MLPTGTTMSRVTTPMNRAEKNQRLPEAGCAHTRGLTDAWLTDHGHSIAEVHQWLDDNGGFCDCEVLANSEQAWREATGRR
jgi:hypothetical protein